MNAILKLMTDKQTNSSNNSSCVLCCKDVEIYAIGSCNHPICYECSTRLRVLCKNNECPLCRLKMKKVYFTCLIKPYEELYRHYKSENSGDITHGIYYFSPGLKERIELLFARTCYICKDVSWKFKTNEKLELHLLREHGLLYCPVCVEHLKFFRFERRCYTESELERHNREGDPDDTSYRGHSLCEFCSKYFFDKDELYVHLRRDHFRCHLCSEDRNKRSFFNTRADLYTHFRNDHYLCQKGKCITEQLISVFETETEYKNHLTVAHQKQDGAFKLRQPFQTVFIREYNNSFSSNSNINSATLNQACALEPFPQLSQQSRSSNSPEFPIPKIATNNGRTNLSWATTTNQASTSKVSASKTYPTLKLSQNTRDNFFKQFKSNTDSQLSTSFGRIKKAQSKATTQLPSSSRNAESQVFSPWSVPEPHLNTCQWKKENQKNGKEPRRKPQLSQSSRDRFFQQFQSAEPVQPTSQKDAQPLFSFGIVNVLKEKKDSNETAKRKSRKEK